MRALIPLETGDIGPSVVDLHHALDLLDVGGPVTQQERSEKRFGDGTREGVALLQARYVWSDLTVGVFDEPCAARTNQLLSARGDLDIDEDAAPPLLWDRFQVAGTNAASDSSDLAALSRHPGNLEVWWTNPSNRVRGGYWYDDGKGWQTPYTVPGRVTSPQSGIAAVSRKSDTMETWRIDSARSVRGAFWYDAADTSWKEYRDPVAAGQSEDRASAQTGIAAVSRGPTFQEMWWIAEDGLVRGSWYDDVRKRWNTYRNISTRKASLSSGLAAVSRFTDNMEVWWVGPNGSVEGAYWYADGKPWRRYPRQVAPQNSAAQGSHNLTAVTRTPTSMDLLWISPGGGIRWAYWRDGSDWQLSPDVVADNASPEGGIAVVSRNATSMEAFWISEDGSVQAAEWTETTGWKMSPVPVAGIASASTKSAVAATRRTATTTEVFWIKKNGAVEVAIRDDVNRPFSFRLLRPADLVDLRCDVVGCRVAGGAASTPTIQHKVVSGETLWAIAEKYYGDGSLFTLIAAANKLPNASLIRTGDVLIIPPRPAAPGPPDTYVVAPGDKLWDIAERFYGDGNMYRLIADANNIADPDLIVPGQSLVIPRLNEPDPPVQLVAVTDAHIVVHFGVQHLFEQAYPLVNGPASGIAKVRAANESRVVFDLPKGTTIPFTLSGILDGLTRLGLRVPALAIPRVEGNDTRPPDAGGAPTAPTPDQTAIEAPYRLVVSPNKKYGGFSHTAEVAAAEDDPSRVELWHTRLGVRVYDSSDKFIRLDESDGRRRTVRPIWTRDMDGAGAAFTGSLDADDRKAIVRQSADPTQQTTAHQLIEPEPLSVSRLYLSSLGSTIDWAVRWNFEQYPPVMSPQKLLEAYRHLGTLGRDHYVRVETPIYLYPFGQRGTLVRVTERKIGFDDTNPAAYLYSRDFIVLREPTRDYTNEMLTVPATTEVRPALRQLPFVATTVDPVVSPDFDSVPPNGPFVPYVGGKPYRWKVTGIDHAGRPVTMMTALVVVRANTNEYGNAFKKWFDDVVNYAPDKHPIDAGGAEVAFAPSTEAGDTTVRVQGFEFHGQAKLLTCTPFMHKAQVTIPALAALNRVGGPVSVRWKSKYMLDGFTANDKGEVFLTLDEEAKLDFAGATDRGGGFVEPSISVKAISRVLGGVGDNGAGADGIEGGQYDPAKFLGTALPKLFGLLDLKDIVTKGGFTEAPKLIAEQFGFVKTVETEYNSLVSALALVTEIVGKDKDITDAPKGAKRDLGVLYGTLAEARNALNGAPVDKLLGALNTGSGIGGEAGKIVAALTKIPAALDSPHLAAFLRTQLDRPYRALSAALQTAANPAALTKALSSAVENTTVRYEWFPKIQGWPTGTPVFNPKDVNQGLAIAVEIRTAKDGKPQANVSAQLRNFELNLLPGDAELIRMRFGRVGFRVATGGKPEVDVQFNGMEFLGVLGFIEKLRQIIPFDGFSDPPFVDVDAEGATAGFDLALPSVAIGVFSLENIALGADCRLPFLGEAVTVGFYFCTKDAPFRLTVMAIGGGGWVGIRLAPEGLVLLEMGLEAGASLSVDLVVASGSVSVMIGVYLRLEDKVGQLTGYFRIRGEVEVLGIASASITLELSLTYHFESGKLYGRASLQVEIEVAFFSASVEITCERKLAGSRGDPSLRDIMPPDQGGQEIWNQYYSSFALTGA